MRLVMHQQSVGIVQTWLVCAGTALLDDSCRGLSSSQPPGLPWAPWEEALSLVLPLHLRRFVGNSLMDVLGLLLLCSCLGAPPAHPKALCVFCAGRQCDEALSAVGSWVTSKLHCFIGWESY